MDEVELIRRKLNDLAVSACNKNIWQHSKFLTLAEQNILASLKPAVKYYLDGGYEGAERKIASFGDADETGYVEEPEISYINAVPVNDKFADNLSHRDFLGAVMSLGINRDMIGDIIVKNNSAVIICLSSVVQLICNELVKIRHTTVKCSVIADFPWTFQSELTADEIIVASERIDVLISGVYNLSRNESQLLIKREMVFCDGITVRSSSYVPTSGLIISVRGFGRFVYDGIIRRTKKNRLVAAVKRY